MSKGCCLFTVGPGGPGPRRAHGKPKRRRPHTLFGVSGPSDQGPPEAPGRGRDVSAI